MSQKNGGFYLSNYRRQPAKQAQCVTKFEIIGETGMKTGSEQLSSFFRLGHVPLFSGFMYASVGSFLARVTRILDMRYTRFPNRALTLGLALLIYANFFTHHYLPDIRIALFAAVAMAFGPTWVYFKPYRAYRRMPLLLGFLLIALFIWGAENIGTLAVVWVYPNQRHGWQLVQFSKFGSWLLLMIISFILVAYVHPPKEPPAANEPENA